MSVVRLHENNTITLMLEGGSILSRQMAPCVTLFHV